MSFVEKLDEKSLAVFNEATSKNSSSQCMFFLNAFWDEFGDQAEWIFAVSNQIFRMADMKAKGIMYVHLYEEGKDLDFDMGIYLFEQICKFWDEPNHEWYRGSIGLANWAAKHLNYQDLFKKSQPQMMTSIARKKELKDKVDVNFDGRVSMLEYLLYQYGASPKSLIERSMASPDMQACRWVRRVLPRRAVHPFEDTPPYWRRSLAVCPHGPASIRGRCCPAICPAKRHRPFDTYRPVSRVGTRRKTHSE
jgi:hypothetical protein